MGGKAKLLVWFVFFLSSIVINFICGLGILFLWRKEKINRS
jgi:hypothetical protein